MAACQNEDQVSVIDHDRIHSSTDVRGEFR
jgi:hypothetical protein